MPKASSDLIKRTVNNLLDYIKDENSIPMVLPSERFLSKKFEISRSTLIRAFSDLENKGVVRQQSRSRLVLRLPKKTDYFRDVTTIITKTQSVENYILEKFSKLELKPGDRFSELQIANEIDANTVTVREVLLKISSTGLIKKKPRKQWEVISITAETVNELTAYRELLEVQGLKNLLNKKNELGQIQAEYLPLLKQHQDQLKLKTIERDIIIDLESALHKGIIAHTDNRFIIDNYDSLFFLIRYHLGQHNMTQTRFKSVLQEHIEILNEILNNNYKGAVAALQSHFKKSKEFFFEANELLLKEQELTNINNYKSKSL